MANVPHFRFPFQIDGTKVAEVEQDTFDDVAGCVQAILLTPVDHRDELPAFGRQSPVFTAPPDIDRLRRAVSNWEPRAGAIVQKNETAFDAGIRLVRTRIGIRMGERENG